MQHNDGQHGRADGNGFTSVAATVAVIALGVGALWKCSPSLSSSSLLSTLRRSQDINAAEPSPSQDQHESLQEKERREKTRSKDRRKRNKDPLLDIVKGGKRKGSKKANLMAQVLSAKTTYHGLNSDVGAPQSEDEPDASQTPEAGPSDPSTILTLPSASSSVASLSDSIPSTASSSQFRPPISTMDSSKSNKTIKPPTAAPGHRSPSVFPGPWESMPDLKAELEHSRKADEKQAARSKSRGDINPIKDSLSSPAILPHPPPLQTKRSGTLVSGSSATPELSTQTQLASLRGALEAARLREEKAKVDMEKAMKEIEAARWENANWRRREHEMQSQIAHLAHQLQNYAGMFASMSYHSSPSRPPLSQSNSAVSSPPPHMMASPFSQVPPSAYFPHSGPTSSASYPAVLYATSSSSSRSSDGSELGSESPSSPFMKGERGRQRTRDITVGGPQSPPLIAEGPWQSMAPSLSLPLPLSQLNFPSSLSDGSNDETDGEDAEFSNDALADAIFKNPEFMKLPSPTKKRRAEAEEAETNEGQDFEYPSLNSGYCPQPQRHTPQPQEQDDN